MYKRSKAGVKSFLELEKVSSNSIMVKYTFLFNFQKSKSKL